MAELGGGADALAAAMGLVTAEKNTNPFVGGNVQNVCADKGLPATAALRGVTPLIDPDVDVNGEARQLSERSRRSPLQAEGLSVFEVMQREGLGGLVVAQGAGGAVSRGGNGQGNNGNGGNTTLNNGGGNENGMSFLLGLYSIPPPL